ncbi:hypothetical protein BHYA_0031g00460 [Botrytis hyacinthi]|uniref:Uncharacterized protein n=1 Tax=Botrytis hyacinthi TaxID=278943 RepID=A0A4Z1GV87_9HELO|nr:hypothetical protein BHYA_0031g00460 [Botrytis hyacinthi]
MISDLWLNDDRNVAVEQMKDLRYTGDIDRIVKVIERCNLKMGLKRHKSASVNINSAREKDALENDDPSSLRLIIVAED